MHLIADGLHAGCSGWAASPFAALAAFAASVGSAPEVALTLVNAALDLDALEADNPAIPQIVFDIAEDRILGDYADGGMTQIYYGASTMASAHTIAAIDTIQDFSIRLVYGGTSETIIGGGDPYGNFVIDGQGDRFSTFESDIFKQGLFWIPGADGGLRAQHGFDAINYGRTIPGAGTVAGLPAHLPIADGLETFKKVKETAGKDLMDVEGDPSAKLDGDRGTLGRRGTGLRAVLTPDEMGGSIVDGAAENDERCDVRAFPDPFGRLAMAAGNDNIAKAQRRVRNGFGPKIAVTKGQLFAADHFAAA